MNGQSSEIVGVRRREKRDAEAQGLWCNGVAVKHGANENGDTRAEYARAKAAGVDSAQVIGRRQGEANRWLILSKHLGRARAVDRAQDVDVGAGGASGGHAGGCHAMTRVERRARVMAASARSPLGAQAPAAHSPRPAARLPNGRARASPGLFHSLRCSRPYLSPQLSLACSPVCPPTSDCYAPQASSSSSGLRPTPTRPAPRHSARPTPVTLPAHTARLVA
ncbi:hypothetical protein AcV5_010362 [Taiwanofungus camphoratus]|nr:hypothetical protein AcV5_010362 [Antrodia cinnamomea]